MNALCDSGPTVVRFASSNAWASSRVSRTLSARVCACVRTQFVSRSLQVMYSQRSCALDGRGRLLLAIFFSFFYFLNLWTREGVRWRLCRPVASFLNPVPPENGFVKLRSRHGCELREVLSAWRKVECRHESSVQPFVFACSLHQERRIPNNEPFSKFTVRID